MTSDIMINDIMINAIHVTRYWEIKCFLRLALKVPKDEADLSGFGSEFQYLGPLDTSVFTRQHFCAFTTYKLPYILLRVAY